MLALNPLTQQNKSEFTAHASPGPPPATPHPSSTAPLVTIAKPTPYFPRFHPPSESANPPAPPLLLHPSNTLPRQSKPHRRKLGQVQKRSRHQPQNHPRQDQKDVANNNQIRHSQNQERNTPTQQQRQLQKPSHSRLSAKGRKRFTLCITLAKGIPSSLSPRTEFFVTHVPGSKCYLGRRIIPTDP